MHQLVVVIITIGINVHRLVNEVQGIDRLKHLICLARLRLCHVCLRCVKKNTFLERFRPRHLHLYNELAFLVIVATDIDNAVLLHLCALGNFLCWPVFNAFHPLIILQGQEGIEQTDDEVLVLAEYLLESQVGFRV